MVFGWHHVPGNNAAAVLHFSETQMNWKDATPGERIAFCEAHGATLFNIRTGKEWDELSPTTQLLLRDVGVTNKAVYEA
jgi:hypothetical protein